MTRLAEESAIPTSELTVLEAEEVPGSLAALGTGETESGGKVLVAFSPTRATDALLAGLAVAGRLAASEGGWDGELIVAATEWSASARRFLGLVGQLPHGFRAVSVPLLADGPPRVEAERATADGVLSPSQIAGHLPGPADRDMFLRAARGLEGLAAKHGGALRGNGRAVDFVLLASRVAELRADASGVVLTTIVPQRSTVNLTADGLPGTLDALEGQLRKHLNDRRVRDGDEGLRARSITEFRAWHSLRSLVLWPLGGGDTEVLDWVGVDIEGRPVIGAVRTALTLGGIGAILDAALRLQPSLPAVLAHAAPPVVLDAPRLVVGGREVADGVARVLEALTLTHELFELRSGRSGLELVALAGGEARARTRPPRRPRRSEKRSDSAEPSGDGAAVSEAPDSTDATARAEGESSDASEAGEGGEGGARSGGSRPRRRGRRSRGRRDEGPREDREDSDDDGERSTAVETSDAAEEKAGPRFEEMSVFDLDDEPAERGEGGARRRRGRSRRRGRRGGTGGEESGGERESATAEGGSSRDLPGGATASADSDDSDASDTDDGFDLEDDDGEIDLVEVPDFEQVPAPVYDDDEETEGEGEEGGPPRARTPSVSQAPAPEPEVPRLPRGRGAIIAHADIDSLMAAVVLARDIRILEGMWVYPQSELMNLFRNVTTDLREDTAVYFVGFTPNPARDVLQAASLYRDRIVWFDHHDWPPEDLQGLRDSIGEHYVNVTPGTGSSLPAVVEACSRRSRFTDKLVDLAGGRFTEHDYERWGRLWWWRLGQLVERTGDCRSDIEPLLSGRPSDLAREASKADTPPLPGEIGYVSERDFRLVHFAGYGLVVLPVPEQFDLQLTARIARERYDAALSLAHRPGEDLVVFSSDELSGKRSLDLAALAEHVANKLEWVEHLADDDHVARFRVREMSSHPERLDEIVAEIAMGRSILER